ncbi:hypothetical protein LWI29_013474 [Acer saccharum]|uniref:Uncharacterized protein n=1 Tax=Acer saccharum TaxID=4024 RepID=A0AA39VX54_ACESA|nr:hypothetical protein LWI29_013474 [Acer saccharum]
MLILEFFSSRDVNDIKVHAFQGFDRTKRERSGKLVIGENQGQRRDRGSDSTSSSEEEGLFLDFIKWKGECSKLEAQKVVKEFSGHGLAARNFRQGSQDLNFSRSPSRDGPLKAHLDNIDKGAGLALNEKSDGLQKVILSRSQSLDGALKDYLDNIEKAFIRAKLRMEIPPKSVENTLVPIQVRSSQESSLDKSVSFVQETKATTDSSKSDADELTEVSSFLSIPATGEEGEVEREPTKKKSKKCKKSKNKAAMSQRKKTTATDNKSEEKSIKGNWNVDDEVIKVMEIGAQLGINFNGKEREMAEYIRIREKEDEDRMDDVDDR